MSLYFKFRFNLCTQFMVPRNKNGKFPARYRWQKLSYNSPEIGLWEYNSPVIDFFCLSPEVVENHFGHPVIFS